MTTPERQLSQAADFIREFNHATIITGEDWQYPGHSYNAIGQLAHLIRMLPQAIEQTAGPVERTHQDSRLLIDGGGDPAKAVQHLRAALKTAVQAAELLTKTVDHLHSAASPMGLDIRGLPEFED
ncbi:hypothetical protein [Streptomyces sp. KR55]|uniref:hypothetical protein n=1 Tax=Streptomyces sp. KR55 TaxID=3457425 RepID=UPI003FD3659C